MKTRRPFMSPAKMAMMLAMLSMLIPFSINSYLPTMPDIAKSLHTDMNIITRSISSFGLGLAIGQLLGGTWSDISGRRSVILMGLAIYIVCTGALVFVQSADWFVGLRFAQAMGLGLAVVVVGALVRDYYQDGELAQMYARISILVMGAPMLAPLFGTWLNWLAGWRMIVVFFLLYALLLFECFYFLVPKRKMAKKGMFQRFKQIIVGYFRVFFNKSALGLLFIQAASFSSILVFLTESPYVYMKIYQLTPMHYSLLLGANVLSMAIFNRMTAYLLEQGHAPQQVLAIGILTQLLANASLLMILAFNPEPELWALALGVVLSVGTHSLISANAQTIFIQHFNQEIGSANAVFSFGQSIISAAVAWAVTVWHDGSILLMVGMMLGSTMLGIILMMICSYQTIFRVESRG